MLYLAIDLHRKQMTISLRNEDGEVIRRRQVSTWGDAPAKFLDDVARQGGPEGYVAILEVCGFHDWLLELLPNHGCREVVLVQAEKKDRRKTDRRDANKLGELLWTNRHRLLHRLPVQGLRRVVPPTPEDRDDRRLTQLHFNVTADLTRTINGLRCILRRLNIEQHCPTKGIQTQRAKAWLKTVKLPELDRFEMDQFLERWRLLAEQRQQIGVRIAERAALRPAVELLRTVPGVSHYTALALACRIGDIRRFTTPRSLANYWGLTPSCRNSGEATQRLGSITKEGSALARCVLGHLVLHVLQKDAVLRAWFARIKKRRGAKIARVAVMRRLAVIIWHMLSKNQPYQLARSVPKQLRPSPMRRRSAAAAPVTAPKLGALPPDPRDLSLGAAFEGQRRSQGRKKASGRRAPSALQTQPGSGARVTSQ
jgi:transposase